MRKKNLYRIKLPQMMSSKYEIKSGWIAENNKRLMLLFQNGSCCRFLSLDV